MKTKGPKSVKKLKDQKSIILNLSVNDFGDLIEWIDRDRGVCSRPEQIRRDLQRLIRLEKLARISPDIPIGEAMEL